MANRDEVEEFLRRAAARRAAAQQQQQRPATAPPAWAQPVPQAPPPQLQRRPLAMAEVVMLEPIDAQVVEAELAESEDRVGRSVAQHMRGTQQIGEHVRHLGAEVDQADDKLEAHLHQVFDHNLGQLRKSTMEAAAASPSQAARDAGLPGAASIAQMLANPQNLRNAIIMSEIIRRPEENWF